MKNLILRLLMPVLFLFTVSAASAQTGSGKLSGKVLDEKHANLSYASVSLLKAKDSTLIKGSITEENGTYLFADLPDGQYIIAINMIGYAKVLKGPYLLNAEHKAYTIEQVQLVPTAKQLNNVNIVSRKPLVERQVDKTVLNIENSVLAASNNALEILQKAPGVTVDKDGNISLRGKKGVTVMLDGKLTYMSSEQLANLLRSTEGNAVQTIELITNPSAKYDAAGNSGIINIKLKKNRNYGTNGSVTAGGGYGKYYKANSGLTLNHREKKFNIFGDFNYSRRKQFHDLDIVRVNNTAADQTYFDQTSDGIGTRRNYNFKGGFDYFINDNNTIGVVVNGYNAKGENDTKVLTLIGSQPLETDSSVFATTPNQYKYTGTTYNLNYKSTIDTSGQELNADIDYSRYNSYQNNQYNNNYLNLAGEPYKSPYIFRSFSPSDISVFAAKVDYTYPFSKKMKLDAGLKSSVVSTDNNSVFENFLDNNWQDDRGRSNQFKYNENINAGYLNLKREFRGTTVQLGLRGEQTNSKGNSITEQRVSKRHYLNLFPSLFVNHVLSKNHEIGFSYSRRIDRPDYGDLNPFISFVDLYTYGIGNPFLNPQYTNSFEVSYSYKKTINATLGYSHTSDAITRVLLSDTLRKTLFITSENLAVKKSYNLNINSPLTIIKWWTTNNNVTVFYNKFSTPNLLGAPYSSGKLSFNANTNHTISVNTSTNIEMSGYYQSAMVEGTLAMKPQYGIDLGLSKSFADKKLNVKLAANDVFNLQRWRITSALPGQNYSVSEKEESRIFRLTCTYRFGSNDIKGARQRSKGSDAEQNRVKSGG
ncbi:outer membrane beta-barrel family protein [Pedobacter hartonius]|uniref:Outer membrane receptor proteins, mostly Fe transport n=1 Tax=Pedobacter hartonius TaxID=425514 RepID=A0A1H4CR27_9SPHI|nr:outer membrane beta-barrel family protein [Pedobacter hartonius]SEA62729.1 Outer membrane receptor proteins, mostly Fe transport [Pedobacter hartonius]